MKNLKSILAAVVIASAVTSTAQATVITSNSVDLVYSGDWSCADYFEMALFPAKYVDRTGDPNRAGVYYDINKSWKFDKNRKNWRSQGVFVPEVFKELVYTTDSEGNLWNSGDYVETKSSTKNPNPCSIY